MNLPKIVASVLAICAFSAQAGNAPLKILIVNDDGCESPGSTSLQDKLKAKGYDVWMVAPATNQSGIGSAITFKTGKVFDVKKVAEQRYCFPGTPADAVDFGLQPGTTVEKDSTDIPAYLSAHKMSLHQNSFSEVLALAELKDCLPEEIRLIGAQPLDMTYGNTLSPLLLSRLDTLVDMALHQLQAWGVPGRPACPESVFQNPEISLERYVPLPA